MIKVLIRKNNFMNVALHQIGLHAKCKQLAHIRSRNYSTGYQNIPAQLAIDTERVWPEAPQRYSLLTKQGSHAKTDRLLCVLIKRVIANVEIKKRPAHQGTFHAANLGTINCCTRKWKRRVRWHFFSKLQLNREKNPARYNYELGSNCLGFNWQPLDSNHSCY